MIDNFEVFSRWSRETPAWNGYVVGTCPRCLRAHRFDNPVSGGPNYPVRGCADARTEGCYLVARSEPMSELRRPLRSADDPADPHTPWVRVSPVRDHPPF